MKVKVDIHKLSEQLSYEYYEDLEVEEMDFDTDKIRALAIDKLRAETLLQSKEETNMKNKTPRKLLIAIVAAVALTTTAYAAGKTEFFREIFGGSILEAEGDIQEMFLSAEDDNFKMNAEQLISDGFNTKIIVSLEGKGIEAKRWLADPDLGAIFSATSANRKEAALAMEATEPLPQFNTEEKQYYCVTYSSNEDYSGEPITLTLKQITSGSNPGAPEEAVVTPDLSLVIEAPKSIDKQKTILFENAKAGETDIVSISVNAISAVLVLQEDAVEKTPTIDVVLAMKDGSREVLFEGGWISEGQGGGGISIADDISELPLSSGYSYKRDLDTNQVIQTATFSRILDLNAVDHLLVNGQRFDF